ncbi:hypothetical protein EJB05_29702 [Eragrostis curvula]|uniref:Uncharacterized protein n=1 Tax=Eragrostis curvula TaxID=38414 RepID=A0A5J9SUM0_9POAL|nr:hypothetical protein EJB05_51874 [Eragrostis curvula]TVU27122.1 hypothetical protein EJB05_29702 [Eragrostis curvula]
MSPFSLSLVGNEGGPFIVFVELYVCMYTSYEYEIVHFLVCMMYYIFRNQRIYHGASGKFFLLGVRSCLFQDFDTAKHSIRVEEGLYSQQSTRARQVICLYIMLHDDHTWSDLFTPGIE